MYIALHRDPEHALITHVSLSYSLSLSPSLSLSLPPFLPSSLSLPQSLGLMISATVTKPGTALTIAALTVLTSMLLAGFYVRQLPSWLEWARNLSFVTFSYDALLQLEFTDDRMFR